MIIPKTCRRRLSLIELIAVSRYNEFVLRMMVKRKKNQTHDTKVKEETGLYCPHCNEEEYGSVKVKCNKQAWQHEQCLDPRRLCFLVINSFFHSEKYKNTKCDGAPAVNAVAEDRIQECI